MAVSPVTYPGQSNAAGDTRALQLLKFSGEVLTQFDEATVMKDLHMIRTAPAGSKSVQFPVLGRATAAYHQPGNNILLSTDTNRDTNAELSTIRHAQRIIAVDELLQSSVFVDSLEELLNHFDVRSIYSMELGRALARVFDNHTIRTAIAAARADATLTGGGTAPAAGGTLQDADFATSGTSAIDTMFRLAEEFDLRDLPQMDRVAVVPPGAYYTMVQETDLISRDWNPSNGSIAEGEIIRVAGIRVVPSVNIPSGDEDTTSVSSGDVTDSPGSTTSSHVNQVGTNGSANTVFDRSADDGAGYGSDFQTTIAVAFHKSAFGTVKAMDLTVESDYLIQYQGTFMIAKYAMGHGVLRPEAAVEISTDADANLLQ